MKKFTLVGLLLLFLAGEGFGQGLPVQGHVVSAEDRMPLPGASVRLKDTQLLTITDSQGEFQLMSPEAKASITVSFIGFKTLEMELILPLEDPLEIVLEQDATLLQGVDVFATGYQEIPKDRQTGSFVGLDSELVNRRVSTSIMDRLEDVTPGLIFNRTGSTTDRISIRGRSTIFSNASPLIVIDNFPYDGPIEAINPNDVESISVLRDAAAASIWGALAGNGVIVITTKSGTAGQKVQVSLTANSTWIQRPDPFYQPQMSSAEVVDMEMRLFEQGYYRNLENSTTRAPLTPVVENLILNRDGQLSDSELDLRIAGFRMQDVRQDYRDYLYQSALNQQYNLSLKGGLANYRYYISAGWDSNRQNLQTNSQDRATLMSNQNLSLLKGKLDLGLGLNLISASNHGCNQGPGALRFTGASPLYAYARLVDEQGSGVGFYSGIREGFAREAEANGLLPWALNPLEELHLVDRSQTEEDLRINLSAKYEVLHGLSAEMYYQLWRGHSTSQVLSGAESFAVRDMVNRFTQRDSETGALSYPIPQGANFQFSESSGLGQNFRSMLRYNRQLGKKGDLNALGGFEVKMLKRDGMHTGYFGYSEETGVSIPVDFVGLYSQYPNPATQSRISYPNSITGIRDNFVSWFTNGSYSYDQRYTLSFSVRKDASNLFGVNANQKAVPLWSTGLAWTITEEKWSMPNWVDFLRIRSTYGVNGNVNKSVAALTTSRMLGTSRYTSYPVANLNSPPNPNLKWETIKILNMGMDFDLWQGRLSGSWEYYRKKGEDLIGDMPFAPNTGVTEFRGNFANTLTRGMDLQLSGLVIDRGLRWKVDFFHSNLKEKVVDYQLETTVLNYLGQATGADPSSPIFPLSGRPLYAVYSLPFAGLDPATGDPLGILDGEPSSNYASIINGAQPEDLTFHGSARPTNFGSIRNTLSYRNWSLSANITYRLGYYYRRGSVRYMPILAGEQGHGDFSQRWQQPGDEQVTTVPSLPSTRDSFRDNFYSFSSVLVEKGDHIRLQDVRLAYTVPSLGRGGFGSLELYAYANNLGILWKASEDPLDPDFRTMKPLPSLTLGLRFQY